MKQKEGQNRIEGLSINVYIGEYGRLECTNDLKLMTLTLNRQTGYPRLHFSIGQKHADLWAIEQDPDFVEGDDFSEVREINRALTFSELETFVETARDLIPENKLTLALEEKVKLILINESKRLTDRIRLVDSSLKRMFGKNRIRVN